MKPDELQRIRRIVTVFYLFKSIQCMIFIIQWNIDTIVDLLLPVIQLAVGSKQQAVRKKGNNCFFQWDIVTQKYKTNCQLPTADCPLFTSLSLKK